MFTKFILVLILVNGPSGFSHSTLEVQDTPDCENKGKAWVNQMIEKGFGRYDEGGEERPEWKSDKNLWASYECVELPGKF